MALPKILNGAASGILSRLRGFSFGRAGMLLYYAAAVWITIALLGYGIDWKRTRQIQDHFMYVGMRWAEGKIASVGTTGFGKLKSYVFKVEGSDIEFVLPVGVATSRWTGDRLQEVNTSAVMREGSKVKAGTAGGRPIVVALSAEVNGQMTELLPHNTGAARYRWAIANAEKVGSEILLLAYSVIPVFMLAHFLFLVATRSRKRPPSPPLPARARA